MINPGDSIYIAMNGRIYSKSRKGRVYFGRYSKTNDHPIEEGHQSQGGNLIATDITKEMTAEGKKLKSSGFHLSTNTVKIPEMKKQGKAISP